MQSLRLLCLLLGAVCAMALNDTMPTLPKDETLVMRGRVVFPADGKSPMDRNGMMTIELQDTSLADAPAKVIARGKGPARRFPIAFVIKYRSSRIVAGNTYSLSVMIRNRNDDLMYINDVRALVTPVGVNRTKFVEVPVILIKENAPVSPKTKWPELVGMSGEAAVKIIKAESGFTNVVIVREGSPMTLDYRTDRVRVIVNSDGVVTMVPTVG